MVEKCVILAGGIGTRMLPYTKGCAKEMLPLCNKPALQYIIQEVANAGIKDRMVVISPKKDEIVRYFKKDDKLLASLERRGKGDILNELYALLDKINIKYVTQEDANGTGGALLLCKDFTRDDAFLVVNGDDLMTGDVSSQLVDCFNKHGQNLIAVTEIERSELYKYGSIKIENREGRIIYISDIIEKPKLGEEFSCYATQGRYIVKSEIYDYLSRTKKQNGELILTNALSLMARDGKVDAYAHDGFRYDMGNPKGYLKAVIDFALRDNELGEYLRNEKF